MCLCTCAQDVNSQSIYGQCNTQTYLLIYLEGGLELQVISGGQDVAESGLICPKTTLSSLHQIQQILTLFRMNESAMCSLLH